MSSDFFAPLGRKARRDRRFVPAIQSLEDRAVPAVVAQFSPATKVLTVIGDAGDNTITVSRDAAGNLSVSGAPILSRVPVTVAGTVKVKIIGGAGNDTLRMDETNGALPAATIDGGKGNDTIFGGAGIDNLFGGQGDDSIDGNRGNDVATMGDGNDLFVWDPGDGSDKVDGNLGDDRMLFNGSNGDEKFDFLTNGTRLKFLRDLGNIVMDVGGTETVDVTALGGADTVNVNNLSVTAVRTVNLDLTAAGVADGALDKVNVWGTGANDHLEVVGNAASTAVTGAAADVNINGHDVTDTLTVNAQGGNDIVNAGAMVVGSMDFATDAGAGDDTVVGGAAADEIRGGDGNDFVIGGDGNDLAILGAGNDEFIWNPGDDNDTLEGDAGIDRMTFNGANVAENIDVSANGGRLRFFRDVANVVMDTDNLEEVDFFARGGADNIVVNDLTGTDVKLVRVELAGLPPAPGGDAAVDTVIVNGTAGNDAITVGALNGETRVSGLTAAVVVANAEATDVLRLNGNAGNDTITGGAGNEVLDGGDGNDLLRGNDGDDSLDGGAGTDTLDGGAGTDVGQNGEVVTNL
jgi:Ca2+-binding RTX toxin-like protein